MTEKEHRAELERIGKLRRSLDRQWKGTHRDLVDALERARKAGVPWSTIEKAVGLTRQRLDTIRKSTAR